MPGLFSKETLLRHFSENLLNTIVSYTQFTAQFDKQVRDTLIYDCIYLKGEKDWWKTQSALEGYKKWAAWRSGVIGYQSSMKFALYFQLQEARSVDEKWQMHFLIGSKKDPSLRLTLADYWRFSKAKKKQAQETFGKDLEKHVLVHLGYAARMYPKIWEGLETDQPTGFQLDIDEAFEFLKENAWILEDSGYKVVIPSWWTPKGRQRAKIRLRTSAKKSGSSQAVNRGLFGLDSIRCDD